MAVSIHAPVKGRHVTCGSPHLYEHVSIHAPVKGRLDFIHARAIRSRVSIHAPVKGRPFSVSASPAYRGFNPRPREGATLLTLAIK